MLKKKVIIVRRDWSADRKSIKGIFLPASTILLCIFLVLAVLGLGACGISSRDYSDSDDPQIALFFVTPSVIPGQAETAVTWRWTYLDVPVFDPVCSIDNEVGLVTSGSTSHINLTQDTTFTLTCINGNSSAKSTVTIRAVTPGEVWGWGRNDYFQLGNGGVVDKYKAVKTGGLQDVIALSGGLYFSMALTKDRTVWTWGLNYYGSLGWGSFENFIDYPGRVVGIRNAVAISAGAIHALALQSDGTVWAWGLNGNGQLGDGTTGHKAYPVQVEGLTEIIQVQASYESSFALRADGTIWAWGDNQFGQLGDRTINQRTRPVPVLDWYTGEPLNGVASITSCFGSTYAIKADGTVLAWGLNHRGQLGDGTLLNRYAPVPVNDMTNTLAIAAGEYHAIVLREEGIVSGWGWNKKGQLGDLFETGSYSSLPFELSGLGIIKSITAGAQHTVILKEDGTVWAFGWNKNGQLGNGTDEDSSTLVSVQGLEGVVRVVEAGLHHTLAIVSP